MPNEWYELTEETFLGPPASWHPVGLHIDPIGKLAWVEGQGLVRGVGYRVLVRDGRAVWVDPRAPGERGRPAKAAGAPPASSATG